MTRHDGRSPDQLRELDLQPDFLEQPHGSVLYAQGRTVVLCTATIDEDIPRWLRGKGKGWMTAEYSLLPASTGERTQRAVSRGRPDGRTVEIQRLIGRALRSVCDFQALGERTLWLDCDVLQADGGTRCASITGAYVAAFRALDRFGLTKALPSSVAAVSVGVVDGEPRARPRLRRGLVRRDGHERRDGRATAGSSRCRRPRRRSRSRASSSTGCSTSRRAGSRSSARRSARPARPASLL